MDIQKIIALFNVLAAQKGVEEAVNFLVDNEDIAEIVLGEYKYSSSRFGKEAGLAISVYDSGIFLELFS